MAEPTITTAAIALDTSYHYNLTQFTPFTLPDAVLPTASVTAPANGATTSGTITVTGSTTDNSSMNLVGIAIYRAATAQYWNGTTWQAGFTTIPATLATPGTMASSFSSMFTPPVPGYYLIAALAVDGNYNYFLTGFNTINAT